MLGGHVAVLENLERGEKFLAEIVLPPADAGERRGRLHHRALAALRAEIRLDSPDRRENIAINPVGFFNGVERLAVLCDGEAPGGDTVFVHEIVEIVPDRFLELGLPVQKIHDLEIGREPAASPHRRCAGRCRAARPAAKAMQGNDRNWTPRRQSPRASSADASGPAPPAPIAVRSR